MAQDGKSFCKAEPSDTQIGRTFREVGRVAEAKSLKAHVTHGAAKGAPWTSSFLAALQTFTRSLSAKHRSFGISITRSSSKTLLKGTQELEYKQAEVGAEKLLSAEHFLMAVRALNRRFRPLELVRNLNEVGTGLGQMTTEIQAAGNQLDLVSPSVKERASIPNYLSLSISIGMAESVLVQTVSDLLLTIAGLGRLTAYGLLTREKFLKNLNSLAQPRGRGIWAKDEASIPLAQPCAGTLCFPHVVMGSHPQTPCMNMKEIDPIRLHEDLDQRVRRYLLTSLPISERFPLLRKQAEKALSEPDKLVKGPFVEALPDFPKGQIIEGSCGGGLLHDGL